ncbi:MAG TPA: hypothetical protein ENI34_10000, partial [candidate division WOR-3 bacterium]|nr:hypothetical protein [candidate division WOR-3 bacterium]
MLKRFLLFIIISFCAGQINWQIEVVDSMPTGANEYYFNSMALQSNNMPGVVYNRDDFRNVIFAWRTDSGWAKETVDSGYFYYAFSLVYDDNDVAHLSFYRRNDSLERTYLCYGRRDSSAWHITAVDSIDGSLGGYYWNFNTSIALDTAGYPGIAYIAWNLADSLHYIEYAHYNGTSWDTSVVVRDTNWYYRRPLDWSPSLEFSSQDIPYIAFHRIRSDVHTDTLKLAFYDNLLDHWVVKNVSYCAMSGFPVCLVLDSADYPCIAHGYDAGLAYTWWDGVDWHTDYGIASIGWLELRIRLALDSNDNPHILYRHWGAAYPRYCYKDSIWHLCGPVEPDSGDANVQADVNIVLDNQDQIHIAYKYNDYVQFISGFKYAVGTLQGVDENSG